MAANLLIAANDKDGNLVHIGVELTGADHGILTLERWNTGVPGPPGPASHTDTREASSIHLAPNRQSITFKVMGVWVTCLLGNPAATAKTVTLKYGVFWWAPDVYGIAESEYGKLREFLATAPLPVA
jgi:hypothetical protein